MYLRGLWLRNKFFNLLSTSERGRYRRLLQHIDAFSMIRDKNIKFNNNVQ